MRWTHKTHFGGRNKCEKEESPKVESDKNRKKRGFGNKKSAVNGRQQLRDIVKIKLSAKLDAIWVELLETKQNKNERTVKSVIKTSKKSFECWPVKSVANKSQLINNPNGRSIGKFREILHFDAHSPDNSWKREREREELPKLCRRDFQLYQYQVPQRHCATRYRVQQKRGVATEPTSSSWKIHEI